MIVGYSYENRKTLRAFGIIRPIGIDRIDTLLMQFAQEGRPRAHTRWIVEYGAAILLQSAE